MDLLQTVRKEGSRGGRANFKWEDVKGDQHRENYLGHSLMAPVGRWQKNRDLGWYAKGDGADSKQQQQSNQDARKDEIRRIKEAEADALAAALGYPVAKRSAGDGTATNANTTALGERDVKRVIAEAGTDVDVAVGEKMEGGVGFGGSSGVVDGGDEGLEEVMKGSRGGEGRGGIVGGGSERERREGRRSRSRDRRRRRGRAGEEDEGRYSRRRRSRSRSRSRDKQSRRDGHSRRVRSRSRSRQRRGGRIQSPPDRRTDHNREYGRSSRHIEKRSRGQDEGRRDRRMRSRSHSMSRSRSPYRAERHRNRAHDR